VAGGHSKYEYNVTYISVEYSGLSPIPETIWNDEEFHVQLNEMGDEGWELVSTQPLLRGVAKEEPGEININGGWGGGKGGVSYGVSLTAGYYLFWRRTVLEEQQG